MDVSNQDEAERCRDLAKSLLARGQYDRATKLLRKSLQLYPLPGDRSGYSLPRSCSAGVAEALEEALQHVQGEDAQQ